MLWKGLQVAFDQYEDQYDILQREKLSGLTLKMQKTEPGKGYHACIMKMVDMKMEIVFSIFNLLE